MIGCDRTYDAIVIDLARSHTSLDAVTDQVEALRRRCVDVAAFLPPEDVAGAVPVPPLPGRLFAAAADGSTVRSLGSRRTHPVWRRRTEPSGRHDDPQREAVSFLRDAFAARGILGRLVLDARHADAATVSALLDEQLRRRAERRVPDVDDDPAWLITVTDGDPERTRVDESLLTMADGVIGVRGSHEEGRPEEAPLVVAAGAYAGEGGAEHLMAGPWPLSLEVASPVRSRRVLDLRTGVLLREPADARDRLRTLRFLAAGQRGLLVMRAEGGPDLITVGPAVRQVTERRVTTGHADELTWGRTAGEHGGITVAVSDTTAASAERRVLERVSAYVVGREHPPSSWRAVSMVRHAEQTGFDRLLADSRAEWARRWSEVDVEIPADPAAQLAVRFALFHLWGVAASTGESAVGARGLTGPGYAGHVFWDTDVFVLPALAAMSPRAARSMLEYRIRRLPQARALAQQRGLDGARFPWESASVGTDVTPMSGRANGEWMPILTGNLEEHIAADVAWAACHYAGWTGDADFLTGAGRPLVVEAARYWAARIWTADDGTAHIRHVIGPDEYHENVDDNCYTNVLARWNLRRAAELEPDSPETRTWRRLADHLVDGYRPDVGRHEQFTGYDALEPLLVADIGSPPIAADLLLGSKRIAAVQIIKQPDVLMAHHLVPDEMEPQSLGADVDYYLPRTSHGSSLSPAITAAVLARAKRPDEALALLDVALRLDLDDLTGMTGAGLHLATLGGVWQALLFGFVGARVRHGALLLDPTLPARWPSLRVRFRCLGRRVTVAVDGADADVTVDGPMTIGTCAEDAVQVTRTVRMHKHDSAWKMVP